MLQMILSLSAQKMTPLEAQLTKEVEALRLENKLLREKIDGLVRRLFGASSEKLDPGQLQLLLEGFEEKKAEASCDAADALEADNAKEAKKLKRRKGKRELTDELLERLPSVEVVVEPEEVKANPTAWRHVDDEVTKQLDYEPPRYVCRRIIRKRYVKRDEPHRPPVIAQLPTMLERCQAGPGVLGAILVGKYCDHLPLYRQEQIAWMRHGIYLPRQTMARWVGLAAEWLRPIYQMIIGGVLSDGYAQVDETMIEYLEPGNGKTKQGYFWTGHRPGGDAFFHWSTSRAAACLQEIIPKEFTGIVQCDGYAAYPAFARLHEKPITLAGCWAHVRREFFEAKDGAKLHAGILLRQIQHLYVIEQRLRQRQAGPKLRVAVRSAESRPIIKRIGKILAKIKQSGSHFPSSQMGKAIEYTLNLWPMLQVYLGDGRIEIDNNGVENAIRPTAVGKKNWLFIGEAEAGERSAIIFTIIEACRRRGLNPFEYLRDVFTRMPTMSASEYNTLTPENWRKTLRQVKTSTVPSANADATTSARAA